MTDYWREQMDIPTDDRAAFNRWYESVAGPDPWDAWHAGRLSGVADGYREGVSDGLKAAARMCEQYARDVVGMGYQEQAAKACGEAIRALIDQKPPEAG